jgi:hypothetical protein
MSAPVNQIKNKKKEKSPQPNPGLSLDLGCAPPPPPGFLDPPPWAQIRPPAVDPATMGTDPTTSTPASGGARGRSVPMPGKEPAPT